MRGARAKGRPQLAQRGAQARPRAGVEDVGPEPPGQCADHAEESSVIVQRLFALAAQCVGSASALVKQLGISYAELRTYLAGEAMPPREVLLRTLELAERSVSTK